MGGLPLLGVGLDAAGVWSGIRGFLPVQMQRLMGAMGAGYLCELEEIRLRRRKPLLLGMGGRDYFVGSGGPCTTLSGGSYLVTDDDLEQVIQNISGHSVYALEEELKNGYLTLPGGHRVGLTGKAVLAGGQVKTLKHLSGLNIRIAREVKGAAAELLKHLIAGSGGHLEHTVIFSPPGCGKTTLLRDLVRLVSDGVPELGFAGCTVGVVDERSEIAGCHRGVPQMDVGVRTDVLDGCPKAQGMMMLLRAMSPDVIVTDEIGKMEDVRALEEVFNAGVRVIVTIHGASLQELANRPALGYLLRLGIIQRFVLLGRSRGVGTVEKIMSQRDLPRVGVGAC